MTGTQQKAYLLHQKGSGFIPIDGEDYHPGLYLYAIIADGQLFDIKQMELTE